ncbi:hypothetical protein BJV82DRAFT_670491 [Fennellomyces sp. T-0311]|nr:hypothetical protein BJV82DRAFT_670491 [Fennellomyces sp. T-0311]
MDINEFLSLLKSQSQNADHQEPIDQVRSTDQQFLDVTISIAQAPSTSQTTESALDIPSGISLSAIDPSLIAEVRQEYLSQQTPSEQRLDEDSLGTLLDSLQNATQVTPQVLVALGRMCKETNLLQVLRECKQSQHRKEEELNSRRTEIEGRYQKSRDAYFAQELVGITPDWEGLEKQAQADLRKMDMHIVREMDNELRSQQEKLAKLKVPFFRQTVGREDMQMQHKVLSILLDMLDE